MHRFEPVLRVVLIVTWSIAALSLVVLPFAGSDLGALLVALTLVNCAGGVAVAAVTYPGAWAIFTYAGYRSFVGLWTTAIVTVVIGAIVAAIASLVDGSVAPFVGVGFFLLLILGAHLAGMLAYLLIGEFFVAVFLVIGARVRRVPAPLDRLATGLLLFLIPTVAICSVLSLPEGETVTGTPKGKAIVTLLLTVIRFEGTPLELTMAWLTRTALVGIGLCALWLFELKAQGRVTTREGDRRAARLQREHDATRRAAL